MIIGLKMTVKTKPSHGIQGIDPTVVLASTSIYRKSLLNRILPTFELLDPGVEETPRSGERSDQLALRLADAKANVGASIKPEAIVIGSDQVADCDGEILGKPRTRDAAISQLTRSAGRIVTFHTAVCVMSGARGTEHHVDVTSVRFRELRHAEIARYVDIERPLDCAGAFKCEGAGIALFDAIETIDPTALNGLPLIWLSAALRRAGLAIP